MTTHCLPSKIVLRRQNHFHLHLDTSVHLKFLFQESSILLVIFSISIQDRENWGHSRRPGVRTEIKVKNDYYEEYRWSTYMCDNGSSDDAIQNITIVAVGRQYDATEALKRKE